MGVRPGFLAIGVALGVACAAALLAFVVAAPACRHAPRGVSPAHPATRVDTVQAVDAAGASPAPAPSAHEIPAKPAPHSTLPIPAPLVDARDLAAPKVTVKTQLALLSAGRIEAFRETLLPSLRPSLTAALFAACQHRIRQSAVLPDWEMAEEAVVEGHRVIRVSMFGKSMTGFHNIGDRWLADSVWCRPTVP